MNKSIISKPFSLSPELIQNGDSGWQRLQVGVTLRMLFQDADSDYSVGLIRYEPGASVPLHLHTGDEHIYVLSGSQQDERGVYRAGSYVYNPEGSQHSVRSEEGCMVLVHWHKPVQFMAE
jgi:anti-sigma factor ChrR (cupin superfamily)